MKEQKILWVVLIVALLMVPSVGISIPSVAIADDQGPDHAVGNLGTGQFPSASIASTAGAGACPGEGAVVYVTCDPGTDISDEIQAAANDLKSLGGGTIYLPSGDFQFTDMVEMPGGINIIGQGQGKTLLRSDGSMFFDINHYGKEGGAFRMTGISFYGAPEESDTRTNGGIAIYNIVDFRIDHCYFERILYNVGVRSREEYPQSRGVVDHCSFMAADLTAAYGVFDTRYGTDWNAADTKFLLGTSGATFVEDCYFEGMGHPGASFDGGHYVLRHSTIVDSSSIDAHGPGFGCCDRGARATEIYGNNIYHNPGDYGWTAIGLRAGGGVIFDNTFKNYDHYARFSIDLGSYNSTDPPGTYPTLDQVTDMWLWDNTLIDIVYDPNDPDYQDDLSDPDRSTVSGILLYSNKAGILIQKDRDFHLRQPLQGQDGFTYTPYIYPHPLTQELSLTGIPDDQAIHLIWDICAALSPTSTWRIDYDGPAGDEPSPVTNIVSPTRVYTLTGLTNYEWYTVTLYAMVDATPILSGTACVMPTNRFIYMPLVLKE